jgi:lipopolysaccharide biosynthesis glycosyltransferase
MFDNNYVLPARVAIYSMLKNANMDYHYNIHILFSEKSLSTRSKELLSKLVNKFINASINFKEIKLKEFSLWEDVCSAHYSKEIFIKLKLASIFSQYDKIICSDVDVIFTGDVSKAFTESNLESCFIAGVRSLKIIDNFIDKQPYSKYLKEKLKGGVGAGFLVYNLRELRKNKIERQIFINLRKYYKITTQPEQDIVNLTIPKEKILYLPLKFMFCTYMYKIFIKKRLDLKCSGDWFRYYLLRLGFTKIKSDIYHTKKEIEEALYNPIQIHYATRMKPWNTRFCYRKIIWWKYRILSYFNS